MNEIKIYLDCRYITPHEAIWRLFQYDIHCNTPSIERLPIHLPKMNNIIFTDGQDIENMINSRQLDKTMLTEWMELNKRDPQARTLTFTEIPRKYTWQPKEKCWTLRKKGNRIGRIYYVDPNQGEIYYLRMLLNLNRGATSFEELRTINNINYNTYREACNALGLLEDDNEWLLAIEEASNWANGSQLRRLFVSMLLYCEIANPVNLFEHSWKTMTEDTIYKIRNTYRLSNITLLDSDLRSHVLHEIENLLIDNNTNLTNYGLPIPQNNYIQQLNNRLLREEMDFNATNVLTEAISLYNKLNEEQRNIYDAVVESINLDKGSLFFVYGYGGTGKTYLYKTIIAMLQS